MRITRTLVLVASALLAGGCSLVPPLPQDEDAETDWGPLAVVENQIGGDALATGVVTIDPLCAYVQRDGRKRLLVWPKERTTWEPPGRIRFERIDGEVVVIEDGDWLSFGGGQEPIHDWVSRPNATCPETEFLVSDVLPTV